MANDTTLIVGLGNPGASYEHTRHNIGFLILDALAKEQHLKFKRALRLKCKHASGLVEGNQIHLVKPSTYMNHSGVSVGKGLRYWNIPIDHCLVIVDDVYLPFGHFRFREKGSSGGHNGLKSIEGELRTNEYPRLRVGVGSPEREDLADYVLSDFEEGEKRKLPELTDHAIGLVKSWLKGSLKMAQKSQLELQ